MDPALLDNIHLFNFVEKERKIESLNFENNIMESLNVLKFRNKQINMPISLQLTNKQKQKRCVCVWELHIESNKSQYLIVGDQQLQLHFWLRLAFTALFVFQCTKAQKVYSVYFQWICHEKLMIASQFWII